MLCMKYNHLHTEIATAGNAAHKNVARRAHPETSSSQQ